MSGIRKKRKWRVSQVLVTKLNPCLFWPYIQFSFLFFIVVISIQKNKIIHIYIHTCILVSYLDFTDDCAGKTWKKISSRSKANIKIFIIQFCFVKSLSIVQKMGFMLLLLLFPLFLLIWI